jgi:hypothetical protein
MDNCLAQAEFFAISSACLFPPFMVCGHSKAMIKFQFILIESFLISKPNPFQILVNRDLQVLTHHFCAYRSTL